MGKKSGFIRKTSGTTILTYTKSKPGGGVQKYSCIVEAVDAET
ncbi:hypothetical protein [Methanosarcina lacustris]|nr:hypothetical protein [Methanosarcina lacustris]